MMDTEKEKKKFDIRKTMLYMIAFGILFLSLLLASSYAYFNVDTTNTNKLGNIVGNIDCFGVVYYESETIGLDNSTPVTDEYALANYTPVTITVTNNCSNSTFYYLTFSSLANSTGYIPDNKINIAVDKKTGNESYYRVVNPKFVSNLTSIASTDTLNTLLLADLNRRTETSSYTNKTNYVLDADYLGSGVTRNYKVYLWVDYYEGDITQTGINNNTTQGLDYKGSIGVVPDRTPSVAKKIETDYNNSVTGISKYANAVTDECTENNCVTVNQAKNVYYITSNDINNIIFDGYCWKIIRTTENGGTKLLYNGVPSNGECTATGVDTILTATQMNSASNTITYTQGGANNKIAYVGYMYNPNTLEGTYEQQLRGDSTYNVNTNDSLLKEKTEYWFSHSNINESKLEDAVYCNDRSIKTDSPVTEAQLSSATSGNVYFANYNANTTLECFLITDSFNITNTKAQTNYKVGFMTQTESRLITSTVYRNSTHYWLATPSHFISYACVKEIYPANVGNCNVSNTYGVRPVVTVNSTVAITDGLGSTTSPYTTN